MDFAGREDGPALDGNGFDRGPGANRQSNSDFAFHSAGELRDLSGDRQSFPADPVAKNRNRSFHYRAFICRDRYDPRVDRRGTETEYQLAIARLRHSHAWRSNGFDYWLGIFLHSGAQLDEELGHGFVASYRCIR